MSTSIIGRGDPATAPVTQSYAAENFDAACALLALMVQSQAATQSGAKTDVDVDFKKLDELKKQLADALQQAKQASEHKGFWGFVGHILGGDVAKIAGAVASVAAVVASGGAAAPLVLLAISTALQVGAKVGSELGLDPKLCAALSIASVAVGMCSGTPSTQAANELSQIMHAVSLGANATSATATAAGAACTYRGDLYHADEMGYQADASDVRARQTVTNLNIDDAIALLEESLRIQTAETEGASEIVQSDSDSKTALFNRI